MDSIGQTACFHAVALNEEMTDVRSLLGKDEFAQIINLAHGFDSSEGAGQCMQCCCIGWWWFCVTMERLRRALPGW